MAPDLDNGSFPLERCDINAVRYWSGSPQLIAQRWYIQICLFASATHDRFLAAEESNRGNKNWSATMSYYSIVHACRSMLFQCYGDFPTGHREMARFLNLGEEIRNGNANNAFRLRFNWLSGFLGHTQAQGLSPRMQTMSDLSRSHNILCSYYKETLHAPKVMSSLSNFGPLVMEAKKLREDSNYEALLIAHESRHSHVSSALESLCQHLSDLANEFVNAARDALVAGLEHEPDLENDRMRIKALAHRFMNARLAPTICAKLSGDTKNSFEAWIQQIELPHADGTDDAWEDVSFEFFGGKQTLMKGYIENIDKLGAKINEAKASIQQQDNMVSTLENGG